MTSNGRRHRTALLLAVCSALPSTEPALAEAAGCVAAPGLHVERATGDGITLTWPGSCLAGDTDFEIYEGSLDDPGGLAPATCTTGGAATYTYVPADGDRFFLVVPRNATHEGSYGTDGTWAERFPSALACLPQAVGVCPESMTLADIGSGQYRWMDVADQLYSVDYRASYSYAQADAIVQFFRAGTRFRGYLIAADLKPHFAYQVKLVGIPGTPSNQWIGLTGRWWQEEWNGSAWSNGQNLNNKGDGTSPNPNDELYFSRRDTLDPTSPTGFRYRYTGYIPFDYLNTDDKGNALLSFEQGSAYHVLWKTSQRAQTALDGPARPAIFDVELPDPVGAYDVDYPGAAVTVFGEWERLPVGGVILPPGLYEADLVLTEESFHGGGLAGGWAAAMGARIEFEIVASSP